MQLNGENCTDHGENVESQKFTKLSNILIKKEAKSVIKLIFFNKQENVLVNMYKCNAKTNKAGIMFFLRC
jgi:hypothetical protein